MCDGISELVWNCDLWNQIHVHLSLDLCPSQLQRITWVPSSQDEESCRLQQRTTVSSWTVGNISSVSHLIWKQLGTSTTFKTINAATNRTDLGRVWFHWTVSKPLFYRRSARITSECWPTNPARSYWCVAPTPTTLPVAPTVMTWWVSRGDVFAFAFSRQLARWGRGRSRRHK